MNRYVLLGLVVFVLWIGMTVKVCNDVGGLIQEDGLKGITSEVWCGKKGCD